LARQAESRIILSASSEWQPVVLVAEDEPLIRMAIAEHLQGCGFTVLEAATADQAESILKSGALVDVVFSDINMPRDHDGILLARWIEKHYPDVPVVLTSGAAEAYAAAVSACASVRHFMTKPYDFSDLEAKLRVLAYGRRDPGNP
jgi:CheY-like chemotaxis protein